MSYELGENRDKKIKACGDKSFAIKRIKKVMSYGLVSIVSC